NEKFNFLLEGDNLHSLYLLEKTYSEKIDIIYIDPPYNTGNKDFMYNDTYIDNDNEYKHSKWLSFMERRLELANKILSNEGIIFISIDDNELSQLKLLCDEIFGETNFISCLTIESGEVFGTKASHADKTFIKVKDYVLIYCKNKVNVNGKMPLYDSMKELFDSHYNIVVDKETLKKDNLLKFLGNIKWIKNIFDDYNYKINALNISKVLEKNEEFKKYFYDVLSSKIYADQPWGKKLSIEKLDSYKANSIYRLGDDLFYKTSKGTLRILTSFAKSLHITDDYNSTFSRSTIRGDLWKGFHTDMRNIDDEGRISFKSGKKPVRLIKQLLKWANIKNAVVLDFFAGSGTTAQAVLELNKEDSGNRKFILCTNNENNICEEITYERIRNVINGYGKSIPIKANLKYYKTSYIPRINTEKDNLNNNLLINIKNLIQLENGIEIDDSKIRVYLNEKELDKFSINQKELDECDKLYISSDILVTFEQETTFKINNIDVFIIPEYYFEEEIKEVL
ncbi:MAG: site-specific DNA-methyltransferase, partial [Clostridia bacterium]